MNERSSKLFSKLLDVNWRLGEATEDGTDLILVEALDALYDRVVRELKDEMGEREYMDFIEGGRKMFGIS
jgi:hypothetical protein